MDETLHRILPLIWLASIHWTTTRRDGLPPIERGWMRVLAALALSFVVLVPVARSTSFLTALTWVTAREVWWYAKDRWLKVNSRFQAEMQEFGLQVLLLSGWLLSLGSPRVIRADDWGRVLTEPLFVQALAVLLAWRIVIVQGAEWVRALLADLEDYTGHRLAGSEESEEVGHDTDSDMNRTGAPGAGRTIGIIERSLILLLACVGQMGAIGLVLAAKSLARFEALKEQRHFAEFYLIGTLFSTLIAIVGGLALAAAIAILQNL